MLRHGKCQASGNATASAFLVASGGTRFVPIRIRQENSHINRKGEGKPSGVGHARHLVKGTDAMCNTCTSTLQRSVFGTNISGIVLIRTPVNPIMLFAFSLWS